MWSGEIFHQELEQKRERGKKKKNSVSRSLSSLVFRPCLSLASILSCVLLNPHMHLLLIVDIHTHALAFSMTWVLSRTVGVHVFGSVLLMCFTQGRDMDSYFFTYDLHFFTLKYIWVCVYSLILVCLNDFFFFYSGLTHHTSSTYFGLNSFLFRIWNTRMPTQYTRLITP